MRKSCALGLLAGLAPFLVAAISANTPDLENAKFVECGTGTVCVRSSLGTAIQPTGYVPADGCTLTKTGLHVSSATTTTLVSSVAAKAVKIWGLHISNSSAGANDTYTLQDTGSTNVVGTSFAPTIAAGGCWCLNPDGHQWYNSTGSGNGLQLVTSSTSATDVYLEYTQC